VKLNKAAQALGRLGKGIPKNYTEEEIEKRTKRLTEARKKRWIKDDSQAVKIEVD